MRRAKILGISTSVPEHKYSQQFIGDFFVQQFPEGSKARRVLSHIYPNSGIETRHSVVADFNSEAPKSFFTTDSDGNLKTPSTGKRNAVYVEKGNPIWIESAQKALENSKISANEITHLITVSCTGFFAPGPDFVITRALGLSPTIERMHIGFMGCYAAFPAMRQAGHIIAHQAEAKVLIVCLELCTLHVQFREETDFLLSGSVFSDGAGALVMGAETVEGSGFVLQFSESRFTDEGESDMAWTIGDDGFDMILSSYVPKILEQNISGILDGLIQKSSIQRQNIAYWAIHPGGRSIVDKIESALGLSEDDTRFSRDVLSQYGNMSSATILFVLAEIWKSNPQVGKSIFATAFGPGLTVESALFEVV